MTKSGLWPTIVEVLGRFIPVQAALLAILFLGRIYEFAGVAMNHPLPSGFPVLFLAALCLDLVYVSAYTLLLIVPFALLSLASRKAGMALLYTLGCMNVLGAFLLDQYFFVTFVPLGADLFGYSWSDILLTVHSSGGYGVLTILPLILFLALFVLAVRFAVKRSVPTGVAVGALTAALVITVVDLLIPSESALFASDRDYYLAADKIQYFLGQSMAKLSERPAGAEVTFTGYPLLRKDRTPDVLGPFFSLHDEKPNLVFVIVEGLGRSLVGEGAHFGGFTPFLDSLCGASLYWENFVSSSGRTFGVLPGLMGSLPYGENGFMEMSYKMPSHITLFSILKKAGYFTSYYYGGDISFDHQNVFLERQGIDRVIDAADFGPSFARSASNESGFSWGYDDGDLFNRSFAAIDADPRQPRLDVYMTLTTHEPFRPPHQDYYEQKFEQRLAALPWDPERKDAARHYAPEFQSLLYFDDVLRQFFATYAARPDYANTIFFITGDHRMIPIPADVMIDRFHVPFIVTSPMLRHPAKFSSVSSHLDVAPTVLAMLRNRYNIPAPDSVSWLGTGIDTATEFRNVHSLPLMRNKNELVDYLDGTDYLAVDQAYRLRSDLSAEPLDDSRLKSDLEAKLASFEALNAYVCGNDKVYPSDVKPAEANAISRDDSLFAALKLGSLGTEELYERARTLTLAKHYEEARIVCRHLLRDNPDLHDVRVLLGLSYAWDGKYWEAEPVYREVLRRAPHYSDAVSALADIELWQGHSEVALDLIDREEAFQPRNVEFLYRKAKALFFLGRARESSAVLDTLQRINPAYPDAKALRKRLTGKQS